ncbi:MAG: hypothetical protein ACLR8Y_17060 [Alistipes indistinctus]
MFFTARSSHFGRRNLLGIKRTGHYADRTTAAAHDAWLLDLCGGRHVDKKDMICILGDLTFFKSEDARHLLEKLPRTQISHNPGSHDGSIKAYPNCFRPQHRYSNLTGSSDRHVLPADRRHVALSLRHYPLLTWNRKPHWLDRVAWALPR